MSSVPAEEVSETDICPVVPEGGFTPIVEWNYGQGKGCLSMPVVADLNADGMPDVLLNITDMFNAPGVLTAVSGDGSGELFQITDSRLAYGSPVAVGDINGNGQPEIIGVRENVASSRTPFSENQYISVHRLVILPPFNCPFLKHFGPRNHRASRQNL